MAQWLSWLERRPVTAEVESSSLFWVVAYSSNEKAQFHSWDHSSAGRASALQAEGHRFEPYWSHLNNKDGFPSGQRGQTVNLLLLASVVRIHLLPPYLCNKIDAHLEKLVFTSFFCVLRVKISGVKPWMLFRKKRI